MYSLSQPRVNPFGLVLVLMLLALALAQNAWAQVEASRIHRDGAEGFGKEVAIEGNQAFIAARGVVYVYEQNSADQWQMVQMLTSEEGELFGSSLGVDGNALVVGEREANAATGQAYVFDYENGAWVEKATLEASDGAPYDRFGDAVAVQGDEVFVGSIWESDAGRHTGAVYVFERQSDGAWLEVQKLTASAARRDDEFGGAIDVDGDRILIGARHGDVGEFGYSQGIGYIFERQPDGSWREAAMLFASDGTQHQYLGSAVALEGDTAILGTPGASSVYVFTRQADGTWLESAKLMPGDIDPAHVGRQYNDFGNALALQDNLLLVGAHGDTNYNSFGAGAVYIFARQPDGSWAQSHKLISSDGVDSYDYGSRIALYGEVAAIADPAFPEANSRGVVYMIDLVEPYTAVTGLSLIDAVGNQPVAAYDPVRQNYRINLYDLPLALNVAAAVAGDAIGSVKFEYLDEAGMPQVRTENDPPFVMLGDVGGDIAAGRLFVGPQTIRATPYSLPDAGGKAGNGVALSFETVFDVPQQAVTGFSLIDPYTDAPFPDFEQMRTDIILSLNQLPVSMNLQAHTTGGEVTGVRFEHTDPAGITHTHIEHTPPYTLFGDIQGDYAAGQFEPGPHSITAIPFTNVGAGKDFEPLTTTFLVSRGDPALKVTGFQLVWIANGADVYTLQDDDRVNTARIGDFLTPSEGFGVRAEVEGPVGSVFFEFEPGGYTHIENTPPYALFGDDEGDFHAGTMESFIEYTLTATPYREPDAGGAAGDPYRIHFKLNPGGGFEIEGPGTRDALQVPAQTPPTPVIDLQPAYPNPFNGRTILAFSLPEVQHARLVVYDMLGREVARLVDETLEAGMHLVPFDAGNLTSGTYLYRLQTPAGSRTGKLLLRK